MQQGASRCTYEVEAAQTIQGAADYHMVGVGSNLGCMAVEDCYLAVRKDLGSLLVSFLADKIPSSIRRRLHTRRRTQPTRVTVKTQAYFTTIFRFLVKLTAGLW